MFILGLREELWKKFVPKYLEAFGASTAIVGLYGTAGFFDAVYQYPGGWLAEHLGRRRAFLIFVALPRWGISYYLLSPSWPFLFVGLALVMAWQSMASPAIYPFMILAFVVGGLREIGGPARKTMMVGPVYCCRCHWHNRDVSLHRDS